MSLDQKTITIGKTDFIIEQLPAMKGLEVTFAIGKIMSGAAEGFSEEFVLSFKDTTVNIGKMIAGVIGCTDVKGTPEFIRNLVVDSIVKPDFKAEPTLFDTHFSGEYEQLSDLIGEIVVHNKFHELVKKNLLRLKLLLEVSE